MYLKELTNEEFNSFKSTFNSHSIYQSVEYKDVMNNEEFDTVLVGLVDNNNILAASLILIDKKSKLKYGYAPRGFLIDYNNINLLSIFTNEIKKYFSKKNVLSIKLCPLVIKTITDTKYNICNYNNYYENIFHNLTSLGYKHLGYNNFFEALKPRYEAIIDLNLPYYILFKNIKKEYRTKIRSADSKGIKIYKGSFENLDYLYSQIKNKYPRDLNYFKNMYSKFSETGNIELYYAKLDTEFYLNKVQNDYIKQQELCSYYNSRVSSINADNEKFISKKLHADKKLNFYQNEIIVATRYLKEHPEGIITASALVVRDKEEVFLLMDGYDQKYKYLNSKHLLIWKLCEMYSKNNIKRFNLGGITNPAIEKNKYTGLNNFKINFNALCYEYIGDLELVCNETLYFINKTVPIRNILKR